MSRKSLTKLLAFDACKEEEVLSKLYKVPVTIRGVGDQEGVKEDKESKL